MDWRGCGVIGHELSRRNTFRKTRDYQNVSNDESTQVNE